MDTLEKSTTSTTSMAFVGLAAVIGGGTLSAFSAHAPTQPLVWASAYLVLVVGVCQVALAAALQNLAANASRGLKLAVLLAYNLGNIGVLVGTLLGDATWLVNVGGVVLAAAVVLCIYIVRAAPRSWLRGIFYVVAAILLVCIPIGLLLAQR